MKEAVFVTRQSQEILTPWNSLLDQFDNEGIMSAVPSTGRNRPWREGWRFLFDHAHGESVRVDLGQRIMNRERPRKLILLV